MSKSGAAPSARRIATRVGLAIGSTIIACLLGELGFRAVLWFRGTPWSAKGAELRVRALAATLRARVDDGEAEADRLADDAPILHPYYGVEREVDQVELESRARAFRSGALDDAFVVVFLGGSVCAETGNVQHERMRARLAADPRFAGRRIELVNQGRGGFKAPQQATLLVYLLALGWRPDAVVQIDGFNELAVAHGNWKSSVHPVHPMWGSWSLLAVRASDRARELELASDCFLLEREGGLRARALLDSGALASAVLGHLGVERLESVQSRWAAAQGRLTDYYAALPEGRSARGPEFVADDESAFDRYVDAWAENSRALSALCSEHGIAYAHVLQPTLHDAGSKPLTPEELATSDGPRPWIKAVKRGYPMLRERGAALAADGLPFVDLSLLFRDFTAATYYDVCHFRGEGQERFADAVVDALLARLPNEVPARRAWKRQR